MRLIDFLRTHGRPRSLAAGAFLFRQGDTASPCHILQSGLLKATYLTAGGKEYIKSFFPEGSFVGSLRSGLRSEASPFSVIALEPSVLIGVPMPDLKNAAREDLDLANEVIDMLVELALRKEKREHDFLVLSAEENYRRLQQDHPGLVQRLTQNDIARYLGITPVALSRIRGRMHRSARGS